MSTQDAELHRLGIKLKFVYSVIGLVVGLACILTGLVLGLAGVTGHTTFTASLLGLSTNLTDAAPGVVVFVVGIFMVWITKFKVKASQETRYHPPAPPQAPAPAPTETTGGAPEPSKDTVSRDTIPQPFQSIPASSTTTITYTTGDRIIP
jgi:hypothetical protein